MYAKYVRYLFTNLGVASHIPFVLGGLVAIALLRTCETSEEILFYSTEKGNNLHTFFFRYYDKTVLFIHYILKAEPLSYPR